MLSLLAKIHTFEDVDSGESHYEVQDKKKQAYFENS